MKRASICAIVLLFLLAATPATAQEDFGQSVPKRVNEALKALRDLGKDVESRFRSWFGGAKKKGSRKESGATLFRYDEWESWNRFPDGSSSKSETISVMGKTQTKVVSRTTRKKRRGEEIHLSRVTEFRGGKVPPRRRILKPLPRGGRDPEWCGKCKKRTHIRTSQSKSQYVPRRGKRVSCIVVKTVVSDCLGKEIGRSETWYSKQVPGWVVKLKSRWKSGSTTTQLLEYTVPSPK